MIPKSGIELKKMSVYVSVACIIIGGVVIRPLTLLAFLCCIAIVFFKNSRSELYSFFFFLMPFASIFKLSPGSTSLLTYVLLIFELKLILSERRLPKTFLAAWLLYSIYVIIGMGNAYTDAIKQAMIPVFLFFGMKKECRKYIRTHSLMYTDAVIFSSFVGIFRNQIPNLASFVNLKSARMDSAVYIDRFAGLWGDPNYYTNNLVLAFTLTIYFQIKGEYSFTRALMYYMALTVFGAMTGSKSFLLMLCFVLIVIIVESFKNKRYVLGFTFSVFCAVGIVLVLNGSITAFNTTLERLTSSTSSLSSFTTLRSDLWEKYISAFWEHPFKTIIGNGLGQDYTFTAPHNTIIDYIDLYGIVGSTLFIIACNVAIIDKGASRHSLNYIPAISLFIMYFSLSMIRFFDYPFQLTLACMLIFKNDMDMEEFRIGKESRALPRI